MQQYMRASPTDAGDDRYTAASPLSYVPLPVPSVCLVAGKEDADVPPSHRRHLPQSRWKAVKGV